MIRIILCLTVTNRTRAHPGSGGGVRQRRGRSAEGREWGGGEGGRRGDRAPSCCGRTPSPLPRTRPRSLGQVHCPGPDAAVRAPGYTRTLIRALGLVSGTRGEIASCQCPRARLCLRRLDCVILSGLQYAADSGKEPAPPPPPPAECGAFQPFPGRPPSVSLLAFPAKSGRRGKQAPCPPIDRVENFTAGSAVWGKEKALCWLLSLVSFLLRVRREETLCPGAVTHSNLGPKHASNSRTIYSSHKINIQSRPPGLVGHLGLLREKTSLGIEGSGGVVQNPFL
nr:uncharacterized protein LOC118972504 [Manis javanica]